MATTCRLSRWACMAVVGAAFTAPALAQTPKESGISAGDRATNLRYHSVLERYQPYKDQPVQSWRDANDTVGRIGGWRVYAKDAAAPEGARVDERSTDPHISHPRGKQ